MDAANCRVCLKANVVEGAWLDDVFCSSTVSEVITSLTSIGMRRGDEFLQRVCSDCLRDLKNAIEFKQRCAESDTIMRKMFTEKVLDVVKQESSNEHLADELVNGICDIKSEIISEDCLSDHYVDHFLDDCFDAPLKKTNNNLLCSLCNESFPDIRSYKIHLKQQRHTFICDICKRGFLKYTSLENHMKIKHSECGILDAKLIDQDSVEIIGQGKDRVFKCSNCEYRSLRMVHMRAHVIVHTGIKPFRCQMCPKAYTQVGSLQYHTERVHLNKNLSVPCEVCGKMLSSRKHLWTHLKTHTERAHFCPVCNVQLKTEKTLAQHMPRHSGHKNYSCELCAAAFYTFSELCNHKISHKDDSTIFKCSRCDYRVKRKSLLKSHMLKHASNRPHTCQLCGRMFSNLQSMKAHKKKHKEWKLYKCPLCVTKLSNVRTLKRHLSKTHKESWSVSCWKAIKATLCGNEEIKKDCDTPVS